MDGPSPRPALVLGFEPYRDLLKKEENIATTPIIFYLPPNSFAAFRVKITRNSPASAYHAHFRYFRLRSTF